MQPESTSAEVTRCCHRRLSQAEMTAQGSEAVHAHDLGQFFISAQAAPVSSDPQRANWAKPEAQRRLIDNFTQMLGPGKQSLDHALLLIYNKSRQVQQALWCTLHATPLMQSGPACCKCTIKMCYCGYEYHCQADFVKRYVCLV